MDWPSKVVLFCNINVYSLKSTSNDHRALICWREITVWMISNLCRLKREQMLKKFYYCFQWHSSCLVPILDRRAEGYLANYLFWMGI